MKYVKRNYLKGVSIILALALAVILGVMPDNQTYAASIKVGKPKVSVSFNNNKITLKISKTDNAEGFRIYVKKPKASKYEKLKTLAKDGKAERTYSFTATKSGEYIFKVRGYNNSTGKTIWGKYSKAAKISVDISSKKGSENERQTKDIENYDSLVMAINIATTNEDVIIEVKDNPVVVHFNSAGVSGMGPQLLKICRMCIPELEDLSSFCITSSEWADEDFKITIEYSQSGGLMVKKTNAPKK